MFVLATKHFTLLVRDQWKQEYVLFLSTIAKDGKSNIQRFDIYNTRLDVYINILVYIYTSLDIK